MEQKKKLKTEYEKLSLTNDFIFGKIMQDERNCIDMLERLTGNHIESVKTVVNQKVIRVTNDSKGIRYDVYVEDDNEIMYDTEMQNKGSGKDTTIEVLSKRVRAYQGLMDMNSLENGGSYKELKSSYIIFICTFDPFGLGLCCYEFETICKNEKELILLDGRKILFFNTKGKIINVSDETAIFLRYLETKTASDEYTERLEQAVVKARMNKEWRVEYMKTYFHDMDVRDEGIEIGRAEGLSQGISDSIMDILEEYGVIPEKLKDKIFGETDAKVLRKWRKLAIKVDSIDEFWNEIK